MTAPVSVTSTSSADPISGAYGSAGYFGFAPAYNKPFVDLSNPLHLAVLAGVGFLAYRYLKKRG